MVDEVGRSMSAAQGALLGIQSRVVDLVCLASYAVVVEDSKTTIQSRSEKAPYSRPLFLCLPFFFALPCGVLLQQKDSSPDANGCGRKGQ